MALRTGPGPTDATANGGQSACDFDATQADTSPCMALKTLCGWVRFNEGVVNDGDVLTGAWMAAYGGGQLLGVGIRTNNTTNPMMVVEQYTRTAVSGHEDTLSHGWKHLAIVFAGNHRRLLVYLNGAQIHSLEVTFGPTTLPVSIGTVCNGYVANYSQRIAHVRAWMSPLTPAEIRREMFSPVPVRLGGLMSSNPLSAPSCVGLPDYRAIVSNGSWGIPIRGQYYNNTSRAPGPPVLSGASMMARPARLRGDITVEGGAGVTWLHQTRTVGELPPLVVAG